MAALTRVAAIKSKSRSVLTLSADDTKPQTWKPCHLRRKSRVVWGVCPEAVDRTNAKHEEVGRPLSTGAPQNLNQRRQTRRPSSALLLKLMSKLPDLRSSMGGEPGAERPHPKQQEQS
jgi:hypothetical protein